MLLFKRILNFGRTNARPPEKRKAPRYSVGHPFPFKTVLTILGRDSEGKTLCDDRTGVDWAGRLANLSPIGASIQLHSAAIGARGGRCLLSFSREDYLLRIPGTVAYLRAYPQYVLVGFSFDFPDTATQSAYLQMLEPVSIGSSLAAVDPKRVKQDLPGLRKEQYKGSASALLTVLRQISDGEVQSFDFQMNEYGVRWTAGSAEVEAYGMAPITSAFSKAKSPAQLELTATQLDEVRWLFNLAVPNLPKAVPADVRKLLVQVAG